MPSSSANRVPVSPHRSSRRYQSALLRASPGNLQPQDDADATQSDLRGELGEAGSIEQSVGGYTLIFIDHVDLSLRPAERDRARDEVVLAQGGLAVPLQLGGARLADIDDRQALPMDRADLGVLHHAGPPTLSNRSATATGASMATKSIAP